MVELKLRYLDQVQQAFDLVRETSSSQGAQYVADYCQETQDYRGTTLLHSHSLWIYIVYDIVKTKYVYL